MKLVINYIIGLLIVILLLSEVHCYADDWHVLDLDEVSVGVMHYLPGGSDPLITQNNNELNKALGEELEVNINTTLFHYLYWNSRVHSTTDTNISYNGSTNGGQFRLVGLEFRVGLNLTEYVQFGYYHHSQHLLDTNYSQGNFPLKDALELRFYIYKSKNKQEPLF